MTDRLPRRQPPIQVDIPEEILARLEILARNAVIDAVTAITRQNRLRVPREGNVETFNAAAEHNEREARLIAADVLAEIDGDLEQAGYAGFDRLFLANPSNAAMHAAYATARAQCPDDLDAALEQAWAIRRHEWAVASAVPGHRQDRDDGDVAPPAIAHHPSETSPPIVRPTDDRWPRRLFAQAMARIVAVVTRSRPG